MKVAALFAGIAGVELGLAESRHKTVLFCEIDKGAQQVLKDHFKSVPLVEDVREIAELPKETDLVTAGFPCQDLSQAGATNGIRGPKSGIVAHLFRLLKKSDVPNVLIENVPFMLQLQNGRAIRYLVSNLEELGYSWAYRVVDAAAFGLPQRRERVFLIASKTYAPSNVLFADSMDPLIPAYRSDLACGFYWTEGTRGLGWAVDAIPTLKGGSSVGIPSPPAVWLPEGRIVTPTIRDAERLQGFEPDWTLPAEKVVRPGYRWKLVGNSVNVRAAAWIGKCLSNMQFSKAVALREKLFEKNQSWPKAAYGLPTGERWEVAISKWPTVESRQRLAEFLDEEVRDLSLRAVSGFLNRLTASSLKYRKEFLGALLAHQKRMSLLERKTNGRR